MELDGHFYGGVPHWFVLVFLGGVRRAVLIAIPLYEDIALSELWQLITSELSSLDRQLKYALD